MVSLDLHSRAIREKIVAAIKRESEMNARKALG